MSKKMLNRLRSQYWGFQQNWKHHVEMFKFSEVDYLKEMVRTMDNLIHFEKRILYDMNLPIEEKNYILGGRKLH